MGVNQGVKKASQNGKKASLVSLHRLVDVIARGGSYLKTKKPARYIVSVPNGRSFGKAFYSVEAQEAITTLTFIKKKDAEAFKKLIKSSTSELSSDIVRHEITDEGYCL
ncbi:hypothetical protein KC963_02280 [Candidatus Saccharibacteria bacterium]|nr:hypothetical protein [Candidatus Saccharibacteria bacterium]